MIKGRQVEVELYLVGLNNIQIVIATELLSTKLKVTRWNINNNKKWLLHVQQPSLFMSYGGHQRWGVC